MSRRRGNDLQNALATYLRSWWPHAESAGSGRNGRDVLGTPGVWWENKTAGYDNLRPGGFLRQALDGAMAAAVAAGSSAPELPVVAWWPPGVGQQRPAAAIGMLALPDVMLLLEAAGYAPARKETSDQPRHV